MYVLLITTLWLIIGWFGQRNYNRTQKDSGFLFRKTTNSVVHYFHDLRQYQVIYSVPSHLARSDMSILRRNRICLLPCTQHELQVGEVWRRQQQDIFFLMRYEKDSQACVYFNVHSLPSQEWWPISNGLCISAPSASELSVRYMVHALFLFFMHINTPFFTTSSIFLILTVAH